MLSHCWRSNSPLFTRWSSSTPAGSQIYPSPPNSHPPPLLVIKFTPPPTQQSSFTPPHPMVILHPLLTSNSTLSTHRLSSSPAGGQPHLFPLSSHVPPLPTQRSCSTTPLPAVMCHPSPPSGHVPSLPTQRSYSTPPRPVVIFHPYPPSGHPPPLLAANITSPLPTHSTVIFHSS